MKGGGRVGEMVLWGWGGGDSGVVGKEGGVGGER